MTSTNTMEVVIWSTNNRKRSSRVESGSAAISCSSTMFSSIGSHTVVVDVVDGGWSGSATTSFTVVAPPPEFSWAAAAMPLIQEMDRLLVSLSDTLPWTGKGSDALAAAKVSIIVEGVGAECIASTRTIRLSPQTVAAVNGWFTFAHEASHCLVGPPSWARHTAGLSEDSTYGDGGAYSLEARYVRAYIERVGEGPFGEMRARMRSIALKIRAGHPAWMLDPTLILSANGK